MVKVEKSSRHLRSLLIIGILVLAFSLSFMLRVQPLEYGYELAEFDPFFNYRATEFMLENGIPAYLEWHDDLSWHPYGRDVSATSQVMLHTTAATLYQIFGLGSSLYDFTIWFPVVIGSLATVVIFALVRTIGGTTAGLFASLLYAIAPLIIIRGTIGWFKSEPLGLFYGLLAVYLVLSAIKSDRGKISVAKIVGAGIFLAFGLASWGGIQFFILPIGILFLALPFLRKDSKFVILISVIFTTVFLLVTMSFEKTGIAFISGLNGFFLLGCTGFLTACIVIRRIFSRSQLRISLALLGGAIISGIAIISSGAINLPSFRYLNAANPFLITTDMLTDSVAEHTPTTIDMSFYFFSILMVFAGIGAWLLFQKKVNHSLGIKNEMAAFALIIGLVGVYFSSAFVRLEVFGSISVIILSSIGISILISKIMEGRQTNAVIKMSFLAGIAILLVVPMVYHTDPNRTTWSTNNIGIVPEILNSGTHYAFATNDWPDAMQWMRENTAKDAVVASWWDYGYWISTLGERKTLADNATLMDWQIRKIASTYFSTPDNAWKILTSDTKTDVSQHYISLPTDIENPTRHIDDVYDKNQEKFDSFENWQCRKELDFSKDYGGKCFNDPAGEKTYDPAIAAKYTTLFGYWESEIYIPPPILTGLDADYVLINLAVKKLSDENVIPMYTMQRNGADSTKVFWFAKIADLPLKDYYVSTGVSFTDKFWDETLIGSLIPFKVLTYVNPSDLTDLSETYRQGDVVIYEKDVKFPAGGDGPFELVYLSPSFERDLGEHVLTGPLIYKINKEYNPDQ